MKTIAAGSCGARIWSGASSDSVRTVSGRPPPSRTTLVEWISPELVRDRPHRRGADDVAEAGPSGRQPQAETVVADVKGGLAADDVAGEAVGEQHRAGRRQDQDADRQHIEGMRLQPAHLLGAAQGPAGVQSVAEVGQKPAEQRQIVFPEGAFVA